jgi:anion-transporting  ArsA/GET3 family ATPase
MLAAQMAAIHCSSMNFAVRLNSADTLKQRESAERSLNRLARTFTCQLEALKKYRGGEQRIIVQHQQVNVNEGGQAIVGTVEQHQGGRDKG